MKSRLTSIRPFDGFVSLGIFFPLFYYSSQVSPAFATLRCATLDWLMASFARAPSALQTSHETEMDQECEKFCEMRELSWVGLD